MSEKERERIEGERIDNYFCHKSLSLVGFRERETHTNTHREREREWKKDRSRHINKDIWHKWKERWKEKERKERKWISYKLTERE